MRQQLTKTNYDTRCEALTDKRQNAEKQIGPSEKSKSKADNIWPLYSREVRTHITTT